MIKYGKEYIKANNIAQIETNTATKDKKKIKIDKEVLEPTVTPIETSNEVLEDSHYKDSSEKNDGYNSEKDNIVVTPKTEDKQVNDEQEASRRKRRRSSAISE